MSNKKLKFLFSEEGILFSEEGTLFRKKGLYFGRRDFLNLLPLVVLSVVPTLQYILTIYIYNIYLHRAISYFRNAFFFGSLISNRYVRYAHASRSFALWGLRPRLLAINLTKLARYFYRHFYTHKTRKHLI